MDGPRGKRRSEKWVYSCLKERGDKNSRNEPEKNENGGKSGQC